MARTFFKIKNFEKLQHYKNRHPPWIKLYNSITEDYEFSKLPGLLKGQLICLWVLASRQKNPGTGLPYDPEWIRQRIGFEEAVDLETLLAAGWIEMIALSASEVLAQKSQQIIAGGAIKKPDRKVHASKMEAQRERERESQREKGTCSEPPAPPAASEPSALAIDYTEFKILTNKKNEEFVVSVNQLKEWKGAYPIVDVEQELREMRQWSIANTEKRKTRRGMLAFINRWLGKEQDRGPRAQHTPATRPAKETTYCTVHPGMALKLGKCMLCANI